MDLAINGKTALVLGASQGMGAAIGEALAAEGCNVILGARNAEKLAALTERIARDHGVTARAHAIDLTDKGAVEALSARIRDDYRPDILVNNTGGPPPGQATGVADDVWADAIQSLLMSTIRLTEAALPAMTERNWGRILIVASSGVAQPIPNLPVSNTVRSAVLGWAKSLSNQVAGDGITVNMMLPGRIATGRTQAIDEAGAKAQGKTVEEIAEASRATIPAGRYGTPEEFAAAAAFLASDQAGYITGSTIRVDGGLIRGV